MMDKIIYVLSPDLAPGQDFAGILKNRDLKVKIVHDKWPPRVVTNKSGVNILNPNYQKIVKAMTKSVIRAIKLERISQSNSDHKSDSYALITIACNTASNERFITLVKESLRKLGFKYGNDYILILPLETVSRYFGKKIKKPLFLGTSALVNILNFKKLHTLRDFNKKGLPIIELVQEIIWRTKAIQGSDIHSAIDYKTKLDDMKIYKNKLVKLSKLLLKLKEREIILGCTELPFAFKIMKSIFKDKKKDFPFELIDPAILVADEIIRKEVR